MGSNILERVRIFKSEVEVERERWRLNRSKNLQHKHVNEVKYVANSYDDLVEVKRLVEKK